MKKIILAMSLSTIALFSANTMASVSDTDTAYMFGNEAVSISYINKDEMQATQGQLFGMTKSQLIATSFNAVNLFRPIIESYLAGGKREAVVSLLALWTHFQKG